MYEHASTAAAAADPAAEQPTPDSAFRAAERLYQLHFEQAVKRRKGRLRGGKPTPQPTDWSGLLDVRALAGSSCSGSGGVADGVTAVRQCSSSGEPATALVFSRHPGLVVFPAAVAPQQQLQLMQAALQEWPEPPAATNHTKVYGSGLRGLFEAAQQGLSLCEQAHEHAAACASDTHQQQLQHRQHTWARDGTGPAAATLLRKLRWVCLGPTYNWSQRAYEPHLPHRPLPHALVQLACRFAAAAHEATQSQAQAVQQPQERQEQLQEQQQQEQLNQQSHLQEQQHQHQHPDASPPPPPYLPDAALVNLYHSARDTLGGHRDDVERDLAQPIVTLSLGCEGVFLMGGPTRDVAPTALLLRSGDLVVMGREARACYHGVPRVLTERPLPPEVVQAAGDEQRCVLAHMQQGCRINISMRCTL